MKLKIFQVDAFTSRLFSGNPAAICISEFWPEEGTMQDIARENNLSETAFIVPEKEGYAIRWFTPLVEVDLCGHATLAAAHVLFTHLGYPSGVITFHSPRSGRLSVERTGEVLVMDLPSDPAKECEVPDLVVNALRKVPVKAFMGRSDHMLVYASQSEIENMRPDFSMLSETGGRGVIVTAMGRNVDFVSRFFAPQAGINEDPVTGSAHTTLTPYWSRVLGKKRLTARQLSERGGELVCENHGERIKISGQAVTYLSGEINTG
jgi:predicted PhzF superfamily epimerase YddE/YHI9